MRLLVALSLAAALPLAAQQPTETATTFNWTGPVAAGHWVRVRNLSGAVHVQGGSQLRIEGVKEGDGDPSDVRFVFRRTGADNGDVLVCALWGTEDESSCDEHGYHSHRDHHWGSDENHISVAFTITVPSGVNVVAATVNGAVRVEGATGEVEAKTVNGSVSANTTGGPVRASTVNGDVNVTMSSTGHAGDLDYSTVNGSVSVSLPSKLDAEIDFSTVNGSVHSDYPITLEGRIDPRHLHGTIGAGGVRIKASTVNGGIEIRRAG
jgi:hypothetical protein